MEEKDRDDDLVGPFEHRKVAWKSAIAFVALLGGTQVVAGWWEPAEWARVYIYSNPLALPILFVGFYAIHLVYECVIRTKRAELEEMRSDPARPRQRRAKSQRPDSPRLPGL